jgi:hypothetical protein
MDLMEISNGRMNKYCENQSQAQSKNYFKDKFN